MRLIENMMDKANLKRQAGDRKGLEVEDIDGHIQGNRQRGRAPELEQDAERFKEQKYSADS